MASLRRRPEENRVSTSVALESLERRDHFAATGVDADYGVSITAVRRALGANVSVYAAVPAPGDRTYLLAERYADPNANPFDLTGYLTIIRLNAKGRLDPSFGDGGIAKTGRVTQTHSTSDRSGLVKLDDGGRIYFADDNRVLRFHPDGTTDNTFGVKGAAAFASADQKVALCDILPVDNGVLIATTKTLKGVQYFAVQKAGPNGVKAAFSATHDTGVKGDSLAGAFYRSQQELAADRAQFARSDAGIVLARIETDNTTYEQRAAPDADDPTEVYTVTGVKAQNVVVTRLDTAGKGSDVIRKTIRRRAEYDGAYFGNQFTSGSFFDNNNVYLSDDGRYVMAQTDQEIMRLDLKRGAVQRYSLPPALYANFNPSYQLLGDGHLYVTDYNLGHNFEPVVTLNRYNYDGTLDKKFAKNGVLTLTAPAYTPVGFTNQIYLSTSGRLSFFEEGRLGFAVRRV